MASFFMVVRRQALLVALTLQRAIIVSMLGFVRSPHQSVYMLNIQRVLANELLQNFLGVSITVLILVFILFSAGSGAVIALKLVYCFAFTVCFGGALKALYGGGSIYRAFTAIILGLIIFDVGTAFFIEKRQFLDAWYVIYPAGFGAVLVLVFTVIFSSKLLFKLSNKSENNEGN